MVAEDQVGVELDVGVRTGLDGGVGLGARGRGGDLGEEGAGGQVDEGDGAGPEGLGAADDLDQAGVRGGRGLGLDGGLRVCVCNGSHGVCQQTGGCRGG